jgi:hypothetical protein
MERKYALNRDHPEKGELHKYKDIPDRTKHTKRSVLELNGALHKKDSTSACENRYDSTGVEMHCKKFVV